MAFGRRQTYLLLQVTSPEQAARRFFLVLFVATVVLLALVVQPLASALFMAAVLAGVLRPVERRLTRKLGGRDRLSASLLTFTVVILLVGPLVAFSAFIVKEGSDGVKFVTETVRGKSVTGLIEKLPAPVRGAAEDALERLQQQDISGQGGKAAAAVGAAVAATGSMVFQSVMMLIALFFLLRQGDELVTWLDGISPLRPGQTRELLAEFKRTSYAVITSTVITAAVQAAAALVGYVIARVPHPLFFAGVTFFVAFIPAIGAATVCLAAALILFVTGHPYMAVFLAAWGLLVVGLVDNIVKPFLIKAGMKMHGGLVFFALIGGLGAFGTVGLLIGPLVVALFLALVRIYERDFRPRAAAAE